MLQTLLFWLAAAFLLIWPVLQQDWLLLTGVSITGAIGIGYIQRLPGLKKRFKDLPIAKTFVPAAVVTASLLIYPLFRESSSRNPAMIGLIGIWLFSLLLFNIVLCDRRDLVGDLACGVITLPAWLGEIVTKKLLTGLLLTHSLSAILVGICFASGDRSFWIAIGIAMPFYLALTLRLSPSVQSPYTFEWLVEGMLIIPPIMLMLSRLSW